MDNAQHQGPVPINKVLVEASELMRSIDYVHSRETKMYNEEDRGLSNISPQEIIRLNELLTEYAEAFIALMNKCPDNPEQYPECRNAYKLSREIIAIDM